MKRALVAWLVASLVACGPAASSSSSGSTPAAIVVPNVDAASPIAAPPAPARARNGPAVTKIASAPGHTCALLENGGVACWGGQLGKIVDGYRSDVLRPTVAPNVTDAIDVATGNDHVCALRRSGQVVCWNDGSKIPGADEYKVSFEGASANVAGLDDVVEIASRSHHTCARHRDGRVTCFGDNEHGQLGAPPGSPDHRVDVPGITDAVELATSISLSCARRSNAGIVCWGEHSDGAVTPVADSADAVTMAAEHSIVCFVRKNGDAVCKPLVHPKYLAQSPAPPSETVARGVTQIASTGSSFCATRKDGVVVCWGSNLQGELGNGTRTDRNEAAPVVDLPRSKMVTATWNSFCALTLDGDVWCWGANDTAQLGIGTNDKVTTPALLPGTGAGARVVVGYGMTGVIENAKLRMWGHDLMARQFITPLAGGEVSGMPEVKAAAFGSWHGCAVTKTGGVSCWGTAGSLGATLPYKDDRAVKPIANVRDAVDVTAAENHSCALRADGRVLCWGAGPGLGVPKVDRSMAAVEVPAVKDAVEVRASARDVCARLKNGEVTCWGASMYTPPKGLDATAIAMGHSFGCATRKKGPVTCWAGRGSIEKPELGDAVAIGAGGQRVCVVRKDGTVACTDAMRSGGVIEVAGITDATGVVLGSEHACVSTRSGAKCWGRNSAGQVPAEPPYRTKPVPVAW